MNGKCIWLSLFLLLIAGNGCAAYYPDMQGTVVDAETGKPIEGAVVLVEWTKKRGIGDYHTESVKVQEVVTDNDGRFVVSGMIEPFLNSPDLVIYKKGYVCWSSRIVFPDWRNRMDFKWGRTYTAHLKPFSPAYSFEAHVSFIGSVTNSSLGSTKDLIRKAYRWEEIEASKELDERWRKQKEMVR